MKDTLEVINRMEADGVIGPYAIGGTIGALYYIELATTEVVDIFVSFDETAEVLKSGADHTHPHPELSRRARLYRVPQGGHPH